MPLFVGVPASLLYWDESWAFPHLMLDKQKPGKNPEHLATVSKIPQRMGISTGVLPWD